MINTKAIQHNLDWIWPFWVEKQFNPRDSSFIPRGFSFSHVNLTHRNWTAVAHPDISQYPLVDPRGLLTPFFDGWSIDSWILTSDGNRLFPVKCPSVKQWLDFQKNLEVCTDSQDHDLRLLQRVCLEVQDQRPEAVLRLEATSAKQEGWLVLSLRPYNPEGIQFMDRIVFDRSRSQWLVNKDQSVLLGEQPDRMALSNYADGDVRNLLFRESRAESVQCEVGLASAAALFRLDPGQSRNIEIRVPLSAVPAGRGVKADLQSSQEAWAAALSGTASLHVPDPLYQFLFEAAKRSLLFLSADDIVPGPYTYKRFWFRDGCLMLNALLALHCLEKSRRLLDSFVKRQKRNGYFQSQKGEWDSNGQVLWILDRYQQLTGESLPRPWLDAVWKGAKWIDKKRLKTSSQKNHHGLLPPGFSAEHLGPNDYYYWDNFWSLAGLQSSTRLAATFGFQEREKHFRCIASELEEAIWTSIAGIPEEKKQGAIPASPNRRMDAGAIGSLVADYPLQLRGPQDESIKRTADFLIENCFHEGGFFQDMIHSGVNPYLTLSIAQTLLRNQDARYRDLMQSTAELASSTGQWPEAVHPITKGGCMGDGQHGWAAAEWIMMMRNLFVREEQGGLVLGSGIFPEWLRAGKDCFFGPTPTPFGPVSFKVRHRDEELLLRLEANWRGARPDCTARIPGFQEIQITEINRDYPLL